jgi:hypothetical protein
MDSGNWSNGPSSTDPVSRYNDFDMRQIRLHLRF